MLIMPIFIPPTLFFCLLFISFKLNVTRLLQFTFYTLPVNLSRNTSSLPGKLFFSPLFCTVFSVYADSATLYIAAKRGKRRWQRRAGSKISGEKGTLFPAFCAGQRLPKKNMLSAENSFAFQLTSIALLWYHRYYLEEGLFFCAHLFPCGKDRAGHCFYAVPSKEGGKTNPEVSRRCR